MFSLLRTTLLRLPAALSQCSLLNRTAMFHILSKSNTINLAGCINNTPNTNLLTPFTPNIMPACGFKVKGRLRRRCKDCYFVVREKRLYVICKTHPRHKQMSMMPKEKTTWIITHATQGHVRPW